MANRPNPHPKPNMTAMVRAMMRFSLSVQFRFGLWLHLAAPQSLLQDGCNDDGKHYPVKDVQE